MKLFVVKPTLDLLAISFIKMLFFSVMNAVAIFVNFQQLMQTLLSETWQLIFKRISQDERLSP